MLEISNINVSFRSERQEKLFGTPEIRFSLMFP